MTNAPSAPRGRAGTGFFSRPYLILTLTSLFWGGNVVAGKLAVGHVDAHSLMILRWTGAFLVILPFAIPRLRQDWEVLKRKWWLYLFYGAAGYATFNVFVYFAAYHTSGVNSALEQVSVNIFVLLLNFALFRLRISVGELIGVAVTILGVAVIATHGELSRILALEVNIGDAMVVFACFAYAIYSVCLRWRPKTHWLSFLAASFTGAILASFGYQSVLGEGLFALPGALAAIDLQGWLVVAYTVFFPSIISQMFFVRGVELIGSNRASLFVNLIPLFGTLGSVLILGESLQLFHIAAALLIAAGIVLAEWSARRAKGRTQDVRPT